MKTEILSSLKNPRIQAFRSLKDRKGRQAARAFLAEGDKMTGEALASGWPVEALLIREDRWNRKELPENAAERIRADLPAYVLPERVFDALSDTRTPQGIAAVVQIRPRAPEGGHLVALDGVQDPGNVGTILRTADAAGLDGVILGPDCADVFSPKTLRATMGSIFRMGMLFPEDLAGCLGRLRQEGYSILSTQLDGEPFYHRQGVAEKWALVIGSEGNGVSPGVRAQATHRLRLPMRGGAESLNAAIAAGIMMYEMTRED